MPNIQIDIDQDRANSLGVNNDQIGKVAQASFTGLKVTELREGDRLIPVLIRGRIEDRSEAEKIRGLYVPTAGWQKRSVREFLEHQNPAGVRHDSALQPTPHGHGQILRAVWRVAVRRYWIAPGPALAKIKLDPGYEMKFAGEDKELRENKAEMGSVMQDIAGADCLDDGAAIPLGHQIRGGHADRAAGTHRRGAGTGDYQLALGIHGDAGDGQPGRRHGQSHHRAQRLHRARAGAGPAVGAGARARPAWRVCDRSW